MQAIDSILEAVGHTPIIPINKISSEGRAAVFAKYEAGNPSFSLKDRIALNLIRYGEEKGLLQPLQTEVVTATAGNTGIALGMVCALEKYQLILFMPENASLERRKTLEGFGAQVHVTPKEEGMRGARRKAYRYSCAHKKTYLIDQFDSPHVVQAHRQSTAEEILADFPDGVDAFIAGVGTGGTISGVGGRLKEEFPHVKVIAVEPESAAVLSGKAWSRHRIEQIGHGFIPRNLNRSLIDEVIQVKDIEAYEMTRELAKREGLLVGLSSGANVFAALKVARQMNQSQKVLTFLCDAGQRYFSIQKFFEQEN